MCRNKALYKSNALSALVVSATFLLSACGSGGGDTGSTPQGPLSDPTGQISEFTPNVGIEVNYENSDLDSGDRTGYIEQQWLYMQTCLQQSAQEPTVFIVEGSITPTDSNDDVLRHINGQIQASSHVSDTDATIQVRADDFDGTLGEPGSYLRSIMGRYLWLSANLPERDYPYICAQGE